MSTSQSTPGPVLAVTAAIALLSLMDATIKSLGPAVPILQIVFLRYLFGAAFALPVYLATGPHRLTRQGLRDNLLRTVVMLVAAGLFFYSITRMPLVEVVTLAFTAPIFMVFLAKPILGEPIEMRALAAVALGLVGVVAVVWGDAGGGGSLTVGGTAAILGSAAVYALGVVLLRKHAIDAKPPALVFMQQVMGVALMAPFVWFFWQDVSAADWLRYVAIGLLATGGSLLMAWGFGRASAARLAPIEYTNLIWATLFAYVWFDETPGTTTWIGAVAIIGACLLASRPGWPIFPRRRWPALWRRRAP